MIGLSSWTFQGYEIRGSLPLCPVLHSGRRNKRRQPLVKQVTVECQKDKKLMLDNDWETESADEEAAESGNDDDEEEDEEEEEEIIPVSDDDIRKSALYQVIHEDVWRAFNTVSQLCHVL